VLPALIRKVHEAKAERAPAVMLWGTGTPRREFLYSDDLADACVFLMQLGDDDFARLLQPAPNEPPLVNIGCGADQTILELAQIIRQVIGYEGEFRLDTTKPDGTPRKLLDVSRMTALGWRPRTDLRRGIASAYADFLERQNLSRIAADATDHHRH
jgi:GDP-L-fucose synthase